MIIIKRLTLVLITALLTFLLLSFSKPRLSPTLVGKITSGFGERVNPITNKTEFHSAVDIAAPYGTKISAPADCTVLEVVNDTVYGLFVTTENKDYTFRFCHLSKTDLKVGDTLKSGDEIGRVGDSGWATGAHLHFEIMKDGKYINPEKEMKFN